MSPRSDPELEAFVGREDLLEEILSGVADRARGTRGQAWGTWGIGKSWLLREARRRAELIGALVLFIDAGTHAPVAAPGTDTQMPFRALHANFQSFLGIVVALLAQQPGMRKEMALTIETARGVVSAKLGTARAAISFNPTINAKADLVARDNSDIASLFYTESDRRDEVCALILEQVEVLVSRLAERLDTIAPQRGVLLLIDEFGKLAGHPVGQWLKSVVTKTHRAAAVIVTTEPGDAVGAGPAQLRSIPLPPFSDEEIGIYLRQRLSGEAVGPELVSAVRQVSSGLPSAVALTADLLVQRHARGEPCTLTDLTIDQIGHLDLLALVVAEVADPRVRSILREGRIARLLDRDIVRVLLFGTDGNEPEELHQANAVLNQLRWYSFVESAEGPGIRAETYRFHRYIRQTVDSPRPPQRLEVDAEAVHRLLAQVWARRRHAIESDHDGSEPRSYSDWYVYESAEWQAASLEWLYHAGRLTDRAERIHARLEFARTFLEAIWWFGCYVRFDFCEQILDDWERSQPAQDHEIAHWFREILTHYPLGWRKQDQGDWARVRTALLAVRNELDLENPALLRIPVQPDAPDPLELSALRRLVRAHTSLFLAHTYRFSSGSRAKARVPYNDALRCYQSAGSPVCTAWLKYEQADLLLELGSPAEAAVVAADTLRHAITDGEEDNHELLANLHRIRARILVDRAGGTVAAIGEQAYAVVRAFTFLVRPHNPDAYTLTFYEELRERSGELILHIRDRQGDAVAADSARLLRDRVAELIGVCAAGSPADEKLTAAIHAGNIRGLAALLLPAPPRLERPDTVFAVREMVNLVEPWLDVTAEFPALTVDVAGA
jgi:hypothetical protein